ncbi:MAG: DUF5908 family protein [Nannocystaceae bacterium]
MPVEIKELVIRAVVVKSAAGKKETISRAAEAGKAMKSNDLQDPVIAECVAEVMRLLRQERER